MNKVNTMKITTVANTETKPTPHKVDVKGLYSKEHAQVAHILLKPGESLKRHITPVDVFFYILEGEGVVEVGDEQETVGPNTLVESPAKIPHRLLNPGEKDFRVLVVKTPRPTETTRLL